MPQFRHDRDGLFRAFAKSLFWPALPSSAIALMRQLPNHLKQGAIEATLARTDELVAEALPECDVFIGLSSMAVKSAARARELGAKVIIERGARHVLSQNRLLVDSGGKGLSSLYIERELASYEAADVIALLSEHSADSFVQEGFSRKNLFVCPLGVDFKTFRSTPMPPLPLRILFVGNWSHQKGVDVLVDAVRQRNSWSLTHVGMLAGTSFPTEPQFSRAGYKNHEEIANLMAGHHLLVLPSRQDGFGMVLLEALAAGLPVVASQMTGGSDIKKLLTKPDSVEIVEPGNVDDLIRGIEVQAQRIGVTAVGEPRRLLTDDDVHALGWSGYAERYIAFLDNLHPTNQN